MSKSLPLLIILPTYKSKHLLIAEREVEIAASPQTVGEQGDGKGPKQQFAMAYTVGWICAISTEYVAARVILNDQHKSPEHIAQHDNNNYTLITTWLLLSFPMASTAQHQLPLSRATCCTPFPTCVLASLFCNKEALHGFEERLGPRHFRTLECARVG
ncbi:hypothetical protein F5883DRAFT_33080 [Diaporthe sp. PMI_573]|nr:hypothetical protein F5883DRAFT_33080 [Diaporthaceae sp. PMI_573]